MKIRKGFVSNSSSSSFTCDVCNETICERDISLSDCEMSECQKGHTFCDEHIMGESSTSMKKAFMLNYYGIEDDEKEKIKEMNNEEIENYFDNDSEFRYEMRYEIPSDLCPICNFVDVKEQDAIDYLLKKNSLTMATLEGEIKEKFKTHDELLAYIKEDK